jgi:chromosome segregation ATPase
MEVGRAKRSRALRTETTPLGASADRRSASHRRSLSSASDDSVSREEERIDDDSNSVHRGEVDLEDEVEEDEEDEEDEEEDDNDGDDKGNTRGFDNTNDNEEEDGEDGDMDDGGEENGEARGGRKRARPASKAAREAASNTNPPSLRRATRTRVVEALSTADEDASIDWPTSGLVSRIVLHNFMCHSNLVVHFRPSLNVVVGRNGSGKSALLVALSVCLGASARFTQRGGSLADFIRAGCNEAMAAVTLTNVGASAFEPERFGNRITIRRRIQKNSKTSDVLTAAGAIVPHDAALLRRIMQHLNIHVDNPCMVMMQETTKKFLNASRPAVKYHFFLQATQLDLVRARLNHVRDITLVLERVTKSKSTALPRLHEEVEQLRTELMDNALIASMATELDGLRVQLIWALVDVVEHAYREAERNLGGLRQACSEAEAHAAARTAARAAAEDEFERCQNESVSESDRVNAARTERRQLQERLSAMLREEASCRNKAVGMDSTLQTLRQREETIRRHIEQRRLTMEKESDERQRQRDAEVERARGVLAGLQARRLELEAALAQASSTHDEVQRSAEAVQHEYEQANAAFSNSDRTVRELEDRNRDRTTMFGRNMPALLQRLASDRRFSAAPVGPVGLLVNVRDDAWVRAVDAVLHGTLGTMIVNTLQDGRLLEEHCRALSMPPAEYVVRRHDTEFIQLRRSQMPCEIVVDVIECSNPVVYNYLIESRHIESTGLMRSRPDARRTLFVDRVAGLKEIYLPDGSRVFRSGRSEAFAASTYDGPTRVGGGTVDVDFYRQSRDRDRVRLQQADQQRRRQGDETNKARSAVDRTRQEMHRIEMEVNRAENAVRAASTDSRVDLDGLAEMRVSLESVLSDLRERQAEKDQLVSQFPGYEQRLTELRAEMARLTESHRNLDERASHFESELAELSARVERERAGAQRAVDAASQLVARRDAAVRDVDDKRLQFEERREKATAKFGARPSPAAGGLLSVPELQKRINELDRRVQLERSRRRDVEVVRAEFNAKEEAYKEAYRMITSSQQLIKRLEAALLARLDGWKIVLERMGVLAHVYFQNVLALRDYSGELKFNHERGELDVIVRPDPQARPSNSVRTSETLSGGERAFATVAYLTALWRTMETPFRAVDEYDVNMDETARDLAMELIVQMARNTPDSQLFVLTPLDLNEAAKETYVLRLRDPREQ